MSRNGSKTTGFLHDKRFPFDSYAKWQDWPEIFRFLNDHVVSEISFDQLIRSFPQPRVPSPGSPLDDWKRFAEENLPISDVVLRTKEEIVKRCRELLDDLAVPENRNDVLLFAHLDVRQIWDSMIYLRERKVPPRPSIPNDERRLVEFFNAIVTAIEWCKEACQSDEQQIAIRIDNPESKLYERNEWMLDESAL